MAKKKKRRYTKHARKKSPYPTIISPNCRKQIFGRPTKFRGQLYTEAQKLAAFGFTDRELAKFWGVSEDTLQRWQKKNPTFEDAIEKGQSQAVLSVTRSLFNKAKEGNLTAIIFYLTNRAPDLWKDKRAPAIIQSTSVQTGRSDDRFNGEDLRDSAAMRDYLVNSLPGNNHRKATQ